ncbi:MAG: UDP-N-acetylmuramoyl-L-alanyl-D-glutamate--2,6-diaminopimelate ligase [Saprospiraceae bacterium]|nr:UDP-N-acetylmuramoyl-L-alanyl-D-glutamate--2,6-diaminopimelate ligase [Saprospiraceae bacterium]
MLLEARKLFEILKGDQRISSLGEYPEKIERLTLDSRTAVPGSCYIAIKGNVADGQNFIDSAIEKGAVAVVCEEMPDHIRPGIFYLMVKDARKSAAWLAHEFYDHPSGKMKVVGVTGTNGKTTVATLLYQLYSVLGHTCGLISTVENLIADKVIPATHTTPDAIAIASLMEEMRSNGCSHVFMEVSSHALDQQRTVGIDFKAAIFTNITHDHLDYHKTFLAYIQAKKLFFDGLHESATAIINADDRNGKTMVQNCRAKVLTYGLHSMADFRCRILSDDINGLHLRVNDKEAICRMSGAFNAYNISAALATACAMGEEEEMVLSLLSGLNGAEGRMDKVADPVKERTGIVDYAHTPDALENVLTTIKASARQGQKIITVVGCGGDRDVTKRPLMAEIAARYSDTAVFTSDNPRSEDPEAILDQMLAGVQADQMGRCLRISDRLMAIKTAVMMATKGDIILVAGKGHEKYQEIKGRKLPFDDKKVLSELFSGHA